MSGFANTIMLVMYAALSNHPIPKTLHKANLKVAPGGFHSFNHLVATPQSQDQVQSALLLNVVVGQCSPVLQLLASEDQALLVWGNALLVLDFALDVVDGVRGFNF